MIDEQEWRSVLQVARDGTLSLAAEHLCVSQPSLMQCIKKIEERLGAELFDRSQTPLKLTEVGALYVRQAKEFERLQEELIRGAADMRELKAGTLTIACPPAQAECYLIAPLADFQREYPGIRLKVLARQETELLETLESGEADFALLYGPVDAEKLETVPLLREQVLLAVPPGHRLTRGASSQPLPLPKASFGELAGEPFIAVQEAAFAKSFEALCARMGKHPKVVFEVGSIMDAAQLAAAGMGLTLVTDMLLYHAPFVKTPIFLELKEETAERELVAAFSKEKRLGAAARKFIGLLKAQG